MNLLEVKNISKTYGNGETAVKALKDVSFSVPKGEYVAIVGESGSGKSTLLNMIGALDTPTSGKVLIDGKDIFAMNDRKLTVFRRRNIGFIFQAFNLIPELTVEQNIIFPLLLDYQKPDKRYLEELLTVLNLKDRRNHLPSQLSGGQQQRVAIGRALITRPSLILADEPTGNLDSQNSSEVIALLKETSKKYEQTIIMITHNRSIAQTADRVLQVSDGTLTVGKHGSFSIGDLLGSSMGQTLLSVAVVLFLLILIAGVLMISSSMNSSVAQRTKFFGMMRCIGMSKQQIIRFVRLEALNWCKTAVPIGLILGVVTTWGLCAVLRFVVREEFSDIPLFGISIFGIACGIFVGLITVLIAANAPAKHAAKVSPITAVSGNADHGKTMRHSQYTGFGKIEALLGIGHAVSGKKNLFLMTGSFALSIILFLSFSIMVDFVDYLIPQSAATSDIDIASADGNTIPWELLTTIREMDGVKEVYGRRSVFDVSAKLNDDTNFSGTVDLISYDDFDLQCLKKDSALKRGSDLSKVFRDSNFVLATSDQDSTWKIGDTVQIGDETLTIAGLLKNDPFSENGLTNGKLTLITSDETFVRLTGEEGYSLVLIQTTGDVTDENVQAIQNSVDQTYSFQDKRDERTTGTYMAFVFCVYAFLAIIALVTVMNIVNSISMSVSARMKQYGAMRAVGMDERQMTKMIACEAFTYAVLGCVVGCAIGLPLSKSLYDFLIAGHFPSAVWQFPIISLGVILLFVSIAAIAAVYAPAKRIRNMSITATINEL